MRNDAPSKSGRFRRFVSSEPPCSPSGRMPTSTPSKKIVKPVMSKMPPTVKRKSRSPPSGAAVTPSMSTIAMTGSTDDAVSLNFSRRFIGSYIRYNNFIISITMAALSSAAAFSLNAIAFPPLSSAASDMARMITKGTSFK